MTEHPYDEGLRLVTERISLLLTEAPGIISQYTSHLALSGGKQIRARGLLACSMDKGNRVNQDSIHLACSVELFHLATLVHDDIIDDADLRRGQPTLQKKFGKRTAVICGDYLLAMAIREASLARGDGKRIERQSKEEALPVEYIQRVCMGELLQHINNRNFDLSVRSYLRIIRGKTATLFEAAFRAGAWCGEQDETLWEEYAKLGRFTGMIFQLSDDCIDYGSTRDAAKKPVAKDLKEGVVTLPLIVAFARNPSAKGDIPVFLRHPEKLTGFVKQHGGLAYTRVLAGKYKNKAQAILDKLPGTAEKRALLSTILEQSYAGAITKEPE